MINIITTAMSSSLPQTALPGEALHPTQLLRLMIQSVRNLQLLTCLNRKPGPARTGISGLCGDVSEEEAGVRGMVAGS